MTKIVSRRLLFRTASLLLPFLLWIFSVVLGNAHSSAGTACVCLSLSCTLALVVPSPLQDERRSLIASAAALASGVLLFSESLFPLAMIVHQAVILVYSYLVFREKLVLDKTFFDMLTLWKCAEDYSFLFYCVLLCSFQTLAALLAGSHPGGFFPAIPLAILFAVLYARNYTSYAFFLGRKHEIRIKRTSVTNVAAGDATISKDISGMGRLFSKVVVLIEDEKLYLNESLTLEYLADRVRTNRSYLSKAMNLFAGMHFCRFINGYRIRYAVELIKKNPKCKLSDVAYASGFHNVVTFNSAFKDFMNITPRDFQDKLKLRSRP